MAIGHRVKAYMLAKLALQKKLESEKYVPYCFVCCSVHNLVTHDLSNGKIIFLCPAHKPVLALRARNESEKE